MISDTLRERITCPFSGEHGPSQLALTADGKLTCPVCGRVFAGDGVGFIDLMPGAAGDHTSLYVSQEEEFEAALDYRRISIPVLGAGVRQRAIRRMLMPGKGDNLIELGCGNGKFVYWNRRAVDWAVGVDPAPLFARDALERVDLCRADARYLPFGDGAFTSAMSIDVLEHLPLADIRKYLSEAHRVLAPGGRIFIFSNTREGSRLDFIVRSARRLARWLGDRGIIDDSRDRLRKSDHVKAIETYPQLVAVLAECGFHVERVVFWNGLFQSLIENLVMKLAESALRRLRGRRDARSGRDEQGATGDAERRAAKVRLQRGGPTYYVAAFLTELMWLDLVLFGKWRSGPYFLLARREDRS